MDKNPQEKGKLGGMEASTRFESASKPPRPAESALRPSPQVQRAESQEAHYDVPQFDLEQIVLPLDNLSLVPFEFARQHHVMPVLVENGRICIAMKDPSDRALVQQVSALTGRQVLPYGAMHGSLPAVIEEAYRRRDRGDEYYVGPKVTAEDLSPLQLLDSDVQNGSMPPSQNPAAATAVRRGSSSFRAIDGGIAAAVNASEDSGLRPKRLLIVDEQEDLRRLLRRVLVEKGYEVIEAAGGLEALEVLSKRMPDVVILDAVLPEVHGLDICRRIKTNPRLWHIPVIVVSAAYRGWRVAEDLREAYSVNAFLEKPFKVSAVVSAVEKALRGESIADDAGEEQLSPQAGMVLAESVENYQRGDVDAAIAKLHEGIAAEPYCYKLQYHLGLLYGRKEQLIEAIEALEGAVVLRPRNFAALKNLAVLYQRAGFKRQSIEMWERALVSAPDNQTHKEIREHLIRLL